MPLDRTAYYADASTPASLAAITAAMADAEADQVDLRALRSFYPADAAALTALASSYTLRAGDEALQADTGILYRHNGSAWKAWGSDWIAYTATVTNFTIGTGGAALAAARYRYVGGEVEVDYRFVLGTSGASVGSSVTFTLPVNMAALSVAYQQVEGSGGAIDTAPAFYPTYHVANNTAVGSIRVQVIATGGPTSITSTVPFTWGAGDAINGRFRYSPA